MRPSAPHRRQEIHVLVSFLTIIFISTHVASICKSSFYHLHNISSIRKYQCHQPLLKYLFTHFVPSKLITAILYSTAYQTTAPNKKVIARPECCRSPHQSFNKTQTHYTNSILYNLHWLPINYRIIFEILLITYKALNNLAPSYIHDLLTPYTPSRQLCSSSNNLLFLLFHLLI